MTRVLRGVCLRNEFDLSNSSARALRQKQSYKLHNHVFSKEAATREDGTYEEKFTVIKSFRRERNGRETDGGVDDTHNGLIY